MAFEEKVIKYNNRVVFIKLSMPSFDRSLKHYVEDIVSIHMTEILHISSTHLHMGLGIN